MVLNGLLFGLISTLHCAGMCGPLAMAMPGHVKSNKTLFAILYQIGRITVYIGIGSLVFSLGISFSFFKAQQVLSIVIGCLMVILVVWQFVKLPIPEFFSKFYKKILNKITALFSSRNQLSALGLGVLNGLLPCGAIYIAALYCATFTDFKDAILYMCLFGIGTMPVFIAAWLLFSKQLSLKVRKLSFIYKMLPLIVGILMILRGSNLGIPYLSPELDGQYGQTQIKNCCKH